MRNCLKHTQTMELYEWQTQCQPSMAILLHAFFSCFLIPKAKRNFMFLYFAFYASIPTPNKTLKLTLHLVLLCSRCLNFSQTKLQSMVWYDMCNFWSLKATCGVWETLRCGGGSKINFDHLDLQCALAVHSQQAFFSRHSHDPTLRPWA